MRRSPVLLYKGSTIGVFDGEALALRLFRSRRATVCCVVPIRQERAGRSRGSILKHFAASSSRRRRQSALLVDVGVFCDKCDCVNNRQPATAGSCFGSLFRCFICKLGRAATGSPQPPPGGGLQSRVRRPLVHATPLGCGTALSWERSVRSERAAASRRRRPATRVPQVRFVRALRRLQPELK